MASKWELTATDPNVDAPVVSVHDTYDELLSHIRRTYDPNGRFEDEGSGSIKNYLGYEGYRFDYCEIPG